MSSELWEFIKENIAVITAGLSLITVFLSAAIAYFYNIKHKDLDRFYKNAQDNMETLIEPIYFKLRDIEAIVDKERKIELLKEFFDSYNYNKKYALEYNYHCRSICCDTCSHYHSSRLLY
ncbi:hypothetical protein [Bacillus safensis]|uniref:hypothetical protein n=1 Tax=Bacillus safensis TaxID=561879 RepID=UPI000BA5AA3D|nr:hypothetical protein [Bacillus safensis]OYN66987.1 hypothetical protein CFH85_08625 [Bacillus safensis]